MVGKWQNYEELEDNMTLDDLVMTVGAIRKREERNQHFLAAINGIELGEKPDPEGKTFSDVFDQALKDAGLAEEPKTEEEDLATFGIAYMTDG